MPSKFLNISTDNTLGGSSPSDEVVSSQKAIKEYIDDNTAPAGSYLTTNTTQSIDQSAVKTFNGRVNFVGTGDANAIYLSTDTRIDVYGTSRTVLGFASGTFLINNAAYPLNLRGSGARPAWNSTSYLALTSDIGNATLTIQKNGVAVDTFTANATSDKTINITVPTKTSDLTNDDGFITGINSSDVTTALGYTPYNSSNPSGYQANVIETVKVNGTAQTVTSKAVDITVPTTAEDIGAFGANDIVQNLNNFTTKPKMYFSTTDNVLFSANRRFTVAGSGFASFNGAKLFDGSYEDYNQCQVALGGTGTITITGSSITGTYRQGYMLISFYSGRGPVNLSDVTVTIENASGNIATPELSWESTNKLVIRATVGTLSTANAISKITISVANNRTSGTVDVVEVEYFVSRPSSINLLPVVVKNANNVIYGSLTADSLIKSGGTSVQFLKADGSTDSNTYATTSQLPTVNNPTITITQGGVTKGSFTLNQSTGDTIALDAGSGGGANTDLSNLTSTGQNIGNWSSNVTNCITYIPQDISLTLSSGTLTVKAGSKVYTPNGVGTFSTTTITTDKVCATSTSAGKRLVFIDEDSFFSILTQYTYSGNTSTMNSTTPISYGRFYNTETNKMYVGSSGSWVETPSTLPVAVVTNDSHGNFTSIEQVFNGFGYIGSTMFALPGVKGLIPDGRNDDGTLKNAEFEFDTVKTGTLSFGAQDYYLCISKNKNFVFAGKTITEYQESKNLVYDIYAGLYRDWGMVGSIRGDANNKLSNFTPKTVFHSLDWNDLEIGNHFRTVVETYTNGKSWYRIWSDGWIEQGGYATSGTISLLKTYTNANYAIKVTPVGTNNNTYFDKGFVVTDSPTTTQFKVLGQVVNAWYWQTAGY